MTATARMIEEWKAQADAAGDKLDEAMAKQRALTGKGVKAFFFNGPGSKNGKVKKAGRKRAS